MTEREHLECEIYELELEIKQHNEAIQNLNSIKERRTQKLKEMNKTQKNTNESTESNPQNNNWNYKVMLEKIHYPLLEVVDENTVKIEEVEYKKVEKPKPITLQRIIEECMLGLNQEIQLNLVEHILDRVEVEFFPKLQQEAGYTEVYYKNKGWNNCIKELKGRLRE